MNLDATSYTDFLVIEPRQSTQLLVVLFCAHLISALVVLILLQDHWVIQLVVLLLVGASWFYYYCLHITKVLSQSVFSASYHQNRGWLISTVPECSNVQNDDIAVTLSGSSYVSRWWVVLNFNAIDNLTVAHRRYTLLVPVDSVSAEVHRHLRVYLKTI
ncbi:MAG TPA: hypothetical protein ENJ33_09135 [Thiothrix sp.]|nr:hypothetical protein [Thiothrix sp.]